MNIIPTIPGGLQALSDTLDGVEEIRISTENRHRSLTRVGMDKDGKTRGLGLPESHPIVANITATLNVLKEEEHHLILGLQKEIRKTPFAAWIKVQPGVGEKQAARLLASIGDPYMRAIPAEDGSLSFEPRTLRQLWAYTGHAVDEGAARRPKKGMSQDDMFALGKPLAKQRAYLIAASCLKANKGKFREIYDETRAKYEDAVHTAECVRCGPKGKPAQPGSPISLGHQHARALRKVGKEVLRDMWTISREHHKTVAEQAEEKKILATV